MSIFARVITGGGVVRFHHMSACVQRCYILALIAVLPAPDLAHPQGTTTPRLRTGAERTTDYFPLITGRTLVLVANHTTRVGERHLVDVLLSAGMHVRKIFTPEHGFLGIKDAGEKITDGQYNGIPVISLHGADRTVRDEHLAGIDYVLFDVQDVGVRFYTYLSTLHYVMEACARNRLPLLVLDRPNPNGDYVDGPVLQEELRSFVGMHPIPVVHGMTLGELALMINGERWLAAEEQVMLRVVAVEGWHHGLRYVPPVPPSPNLRSYHAIRWYPTLCLFEGTIMSVGRGTHAPFEMVGYPDPAYGSYTFTPTSRQGATAPLYEGKRCYGNSYAAISPPNGVSLRELLHFYRRSNPTRRERFFTAYFDKLCGNRQLRRQLVGGVPEDAIRASWQAEIAQFLLLREQYLLYEDF